MTDKDLEFIAGWLGWRRAPRGPFWKTPEGGDRELKQLQYWLFIGEILSRMRGESEDVQDKFEQLVAEAVKLRAKPTERGNDTITYTRVSRLTPTIIIEALVAALRGKGDE